jgi:hypothetical protein
MKAYITDKFLWDVCKLLEKTGDVANFLSYPSSMKDKLFGLENSIFKKYRHEKNKRKFSNFIYYLKRKGYIRVKNLEGKDAIILTKNGIEKAISASFKLGEAKKRKDGKWIMLIFDMPANNRKRRDLLRSILRNLGYKLFQQSVWITPYDVSEKTEKLLQTHSLDKYVKIFLIEKM